MIDYITLYKPKISAVEVKNIVKKNNLQTLSHTATGKKYYQTGKEKDLKGGIFIKIDKDNNLKISGSLHKYSSFLTTGKNSNFSRFTMPMARDTFFKLINNIGVDAFDLRITSYEVGLNLVFEMDVKKVLMEVISIGNEAVSKKIYNNPRYREERTLTTECSKNIKVYHKMYDKVFEMKEKRSTDKPPHENILRIETVKRKLKKTIATEFFTASNLFEVQGYFYKKWNTLTLKQDIEAPPQTHQHRRDICKEILMNGTKSVYNKYKNEAKQKKITAKIHRKIKEIIRDWNKDAPHYKLVPSQIGKVFNQAYMFERQKNIFYFDKE